MIIAIDIDGVWSEDPHLGLALYRLLQQHGHHPVIVTGATQPKEKLDRLHVPRNAEIICTWGRLKEDACKDAGVQN